MSQPAASSTLPWHATDNGPYTSERFVAIADVVRHALPSKTATPFNTTSDVISMLVGQFGIAPAPEGGPCVCGCAKAAHRAAPVIDRGSTLCCTECLSPCCPAYRPATLDALMARQGEELERVKVEMGTQAGTAMRAIKELRVDLATARAQTHEAEVERDAAVEQLDAWLALGQEDLAAMKEVAKDRTRERDAASHESDSLRARVKEQADTIERLAVELTGAQSIAQRLQVSPVRLRSDVDDDRAEVKRALELLQVADGYPLLDAVRRVVGERDEHKAKAELHQRAMESVCRGRDKAHDGWCKAAQERDAAREQARKAEQERDVAKEEIHQRREGIQVTLLERNRAQERARKAEERAADLEQRLKAAEMSTWSPRTGTGGHASVNAPANKGASGQPPPAPRSGARVYDFQGRDVGMVASIRPDGGLVMWESPAPRAVPLARGGIGFEIAAAPGAGPPSACGDMEAIEVVASGPLPARPCPCFWMVWRDGAVEIITSSESVALSDAQQLARAHRGTAFYVLRAETEALHPVDPQPTLIRLR